MSETEFLISDPLWHDPLENVADGPDRFVTAGLDPPPGWARGQFDGWVGWQPEGLELPEQGWKIHVSARLSEADDVIGIVSEYCVARGIAFKFLRSRTVALARNEKYAPRSGSGKLCALYPVEDAQLEHALRDLSAALAGRTGPYILSDLRWGPGPLYLRYGGFVPLHCVAPDTGQFVPAVREPGGTLVPDVRAPVFRVPDWAPVPGFIAARIEAARAERSGDALPYRVQEVIHYSNGGGIYRAADPETGASVVLREARPHAGLDAAGTDAVTRLQRERATLERLAGLAAVPALLGYFTCWEHHYLVEEYIEGQVLQHALAARYPLTAPNATDSEVAEYARWAMTILDQVERALDDVHARGVVFGDLHPFNVIVRPDGRIALIDFEESRDISDQRGSALGAPGYVAPWPVTGAQVDDYALNCLRLAMFLPVTQLLSLDPERAPDLAAVAARRFGLPSGFRDRVVSGLAPPAGWEPAPMARPAPRARARGRPGAHAGCRGGHRSGAGRVPGIDGRRDPGQRHPGPGRPAVPRPSPPVRGGRRVDRARRRRGAVRARDGGCRGAVGPRRLAGPRCPALAAAAAGRLRRPRRRGRCPGHAGPRRRCAGGVRAGPRRAAADPAGRPLRRAGRGWARAAPAG